MSETTKGVEPTERCGVGSCGHPWIEHGEDGECRSVGCPCEAFDVAAVAAEGVELAVPEKATWAMARHFLPTPEGVRAIAIPVVVAELRRLAESLRDAVADAVRAAGPGDSDQGLLDAASALDTRAHELEAQS